MRIMMLMRTWILLELLHMLHMHEDSVLSLMHRLNKLLLITQNNSKKDRGCIWGCKVLMSRLWLPASSLQPPGPKYKQK